MTDPVITFMLGILAGLGVFFIVDFVQHLHEKDEW